MCLHTQPGKGALIELNMNIEFSFSPTRFLPSMSHNDVKGWIRCDRCKTVHWTPVLGAEGPDKATAFNELGWEHTPFSYFALPTVEIPNIMNAETFVWGTWYNVLLTWHIFTSYWPWLVERTLNCKTPFNPHIWWCRALVKIILELFFNGHIYYCKCNLNVMILISLGVCVFICLCADNSCLPVWWTRVGGGRSEGCARLRWQVHAVWMHGKSPQHRTNVFKITSSKSSAKWDPGITLLFH